MTARKLVFHGPFDVRIEETELPPLRPGSIAVRARYCGISAGTERLIYTGSIPSGMRLDEGIPELSMPAAYPFPYGYSLVGTVTGEGPDEGESLMGKKVLIFHPHQDRVVVDRSRAVVLDDDLDAALATLIPNAETAASLVLDGAPLLGERVGVLGLGIVGRITADLLADFPVATLDLVDPSPYRRALAERIMPPRLTPRVADRLRDDYDLLFELSGNPAALAAAIGAAGYDGRVVVGSWYGSKPVSLDLGTDFHRKRLRLLGSQVSTIAPPLRGRWDAGRRLRLALSWCRRRSAEDWVSHRIPFSASRAAYELLLDSAAEYAHVVLSMEE